MKLKGSLRSGGCSLTQSCPTLQPRGMRHTRPSYPSPPIKACPNSCPLSWWCIPTILCHPLLLLPSVFPRIRVFSNESVFCTKWPKYWSFSFSKQSFQWIFRTDFLQDWLVGSPCCPRDSQESSPTAQFISSSMLSLYGLTFPSIHDYWKNHSFD